MVRVAGGQGFWGDDLDAPRRQVEGGPVDYLMLDYLAEVTMSILQKQKERELREKLHRVVFVKNGDKVRMQKAETGIADNTYIEIKSGVKRGEEGVSGSSTAISRKLKDGMKVQIEKAGKG